MDIPQKQPQPKPLINPRSLVLIAMTRANALTDESMPKEKMQIFADKPFKDWPKEMQDQLRPFGAEMIQ